MRFFRIPFQADDDDANTSRRRQRLNRYIQSQSAEDMARMASEISPEIKQLVAANVQALLGYLPPQDFNTSISTSKENLQNLLASAMLTGYFMHAMEQRLAMEALLGDALTAEEETETASEAQPADTTHSTDTASDGPGIVFDAGTENPQHPDQTGSHFEPDPAGELLRDPRELFAHPDKLDIQLEINTRMDHAELVKLLKALKQFQQDGDDEADDLLNPFSE